MLLIQENLYYILKHLEDRKLRYVHIYYTWCDIIVIFKLHRRTRLMPNVLLYIIRMTSHLCSKYEHTTLSYLLSVTYLIAATFVIGIPHKNCVIELTNPDLHPGVDYTYTYRQGSAKLGIFERPRKYFATDRKHKRYFSKSKALKNTLVRHDLFSTCFARYDNKEELCSLKHLMNKIGHQKYCLKYKTLRNTAFI